MPHVIIDMTMSLDGFVAGPEDGPEFPLGKHAGHRIFDWYTSGSVEVRSPLFKPEPGPNLEQVERMFAESGAYVFGRKTYDITKGWGGRHPVNGAPVFVLTHRPPPADTVPKGPSNLTFVTDGIESAIRQAKAVAGDKHVKLGGASPGKQALRAGLVDQLLIHLAPYLLGGGVRLFDTLPDGVRLEKLEVSDGPLATHLRYRVLR
ncbi:MAG: dihydrofolate reductase family protein [Deltaproteobacteria bacterium]